MKVLIFDLSRTRLFPMDENYQGSLNGLHKKLASKRDYNFLEHFRLDKKLLSFLATLKSEYKLCMFTSETIQDAPEIRPELDMVFEKIFSGVELGLGKKNPDVYQSIAKKLGADTSEMIFVDDNKDNTKAAKKAGYKTIEYKGLEDLKERL